MALLPTIRNGGATSPRFARRKAAIGRSPHADCGLPDPKSRIFPRQRQIGDRGAVYLPSDSSPNGAFANGGVERLGAPRPLRHGDRTTTSRYEIAVQAGNGDIEALSPAPPLVEPAVPLGWGSWDAAAYAGWAASQAAHGEALAAAGAALRQFVNGLVPALKAAAGGFTASTALLAAAESGQGEAWLRAALQHDETVVRGRTET
jgi:predicted component of type VI protein secretion system